MASKPALCCPPPTVRSPLHPHNIPTSGSSVTSANTELVSLCSPEGDKVLVQFDTSTIAPVALSAVYLNGDRYEGDLSELVDCASLVPPPEPLTLEGVDCAGEPVEVSGMPGELVQVVQAPGTAFAVKICEDDRDFELACGEDPATGHQIQTAYRATPSGPVVLWRVDTTTGLEWTGDPSTLEGCGGTKLESDPVEMCDNGVEFIRWVVKKNGEPTGVTYDTDLAMQPYTVTDEAAVTKGKCVPAVVCEPTISSAPGDALGTLLPGTSVSIQKNNCCTLKVTTSAGSFIVSKDVTGYSTGDFKCPVTVTAVEILSGTCDLADVIVTTQFSG